MVLIKVISALGFWCLKYNSPFLRNAIVSVSAKFRSLHADFGSRGTPFTEAVGLVSWKEWADQSSHRSSASCALVLDELQDFPES